MLIKPLQWLYVKCHPEIDTSELESCPACRGQAKYSHSLLKNTWWRRLFRLPIHWPERIQCLNCSIMLDCSGLRKAYAYLLWNRRIEHPNTLAAQLNKAIVERDNYKSLVPQLSQQLESMKADYERRHADALRYEVKLGIKPQARES